MSAQSIIDAWDGRPTPPRVTAEPGPYWEVWMEGYAATCEHGTAIYVGTTTAATFDRACELLVGGWEHPKRNFRHGTKTEPPAYWGCRMFDNEADARRSFG